jgi:hypothetical protein
MKLGDFLSSTPKPSAPAERIEFTVLHRSPTGAKTPVRAYATFQLITEREQQQAEAAAVKKLQEQQGEGGIVPADLPQALQRAHFLEEALRDADSPLERFAIAEELQLNVPRRELVRIRDAYAVWEEKHYPTKITRDDRAKVKQEALGK